MDLEQHLQYWKEHASMMQQQYQTQLKTAEERFERRQQASEDRFLQHNQEMERQRVEELREIRETYRHEAEEGRKIQQAQFESSVSQLFKQNSEGLTENNNRQIEAILNPLKEKLSDFSQSVNKAYVQETAERKSLADQIERLMKVGMTIGEDARNLTSALKGNSKVQGDWGEMLLEELLQNCGLMRGVGYDVQVTRDENGQVLRDDEGRSMRPDVIVNLPDNQKIVIDSKVSLTAYVDMCNAEDNSSRMSFAKRHLQSVRSHIDELDRKGYHKIKNTPDYVMMFIPNEAAYIAAVQDEPTLWKYAFEKHVVLVSPTHLYSVLSIIAQMWRQDAYNKNALEIAERGGKLFDKLSDALNDFKQIEVGLQRVMDIYQTAEKRMFSGRGNVVSQAQKLAALGVAAKKLPELNSEIVENSDNDTQNSLLSQ